MNNTDPHMDEILELLHDPLFIRFELKQKAPSIFNAVGRTHTETWHSALLGWLLNPSSSHGLGTFPLSRFLLSLKTIESLSPQKRGVDLSNLLVRGNLDSARARPNEQELQEVSTKETGRFDVYIDQIRMRPWQELQILVEMKVKAKIDLAQCNKYISYIAAKRESDILVLPVFIAPARRVIGSTRELLGEESWLKLDFQSLYDDVIEPCIQHPEISDFGRYSLQEYIKTLKFRPNEGEPMATSQDEKLMVDELYKKHEKALRAIYEILSEQDETIHPIPYGKNQKTTGGELRVKIDSKTIGGTSVSKLYAKVLEFLVEGKHLDKLQLPISTGSKRYLLATEASHPEGNPFRVPVEYKGYYMEAHKARDVALHDLADLLSKCGLPFKVLNG